jgi:hypothetical protein
MREEIKAQIYELARQLRVEDNDVVLAKEIIQLLQRIQNNEATSRSARSNRLEPVER